MAVKTTELASRCPCHDANSGAVNRRSGGIGMEKSHLATGERRAHIGFSDVTAKVYPELKRVLGFERSPCGLFPYTHGCSVPMESSIDYIHLLLTREPDEVNRIPGYPNG